MGTWGRPQNRKIFYPYQSTGGQDKPQELRLIETRRQPNTIAARAIIRRGTGHKYWAFGDSEKAEIESIAADLHQLIFEPQLTYPIRSLDLPAGGAVHAPTALGMIYNFVTLCVGAPTQEDDATGTRTVDYLKRCRRVMRMLLSSDPSSLGLHPAVYFYSWAGKQQPILFLTITSLIIELDRARKLNDFTRGRARLEVFLLSNRNLLAQVVRKFGTKESGEKEVSRIYRRILALLLDDQEPKQVAESLISEFPYLQPRENSRDIDADGFSSQVKSGVAIRDLLKTAPRCGICGGIVPAQAFSIDHKDRVQDGGRSTGDNGQITHPYCNTGFKESGNPRDKDGTRR